MSIAVIKIGGHQYKVKEGDSLRIDKLSEKKGKKIILPDLLGGRKVEIQVLEQEKGKKIRILKFKPKTRYKKVIGFRPLLTKIKVSKII